MSMNSSYHGSAHTQTETAQENGRRRASPLRSPSFQGHDPVSLRRIEAEVKKHIARFDLMPEIVCQIVHCRNGWRRFLSSERFR